jgi:hypothetical protein
MARRTRKVAVTRTCRCDTYVCGCATVMSGVLLFLFGLVNYLGYGWEYSFMITGIVAILLGMIWKFKK